MSYRCSLCNAKVPPGQPRRTHIVYRPNKEIAREVPVCSRCLDDLAAGAKVDQIKNGAAAKPRPSPINQAVDFG